MHAYSPSYWVAWAGLSCESRITMRQLDSIIDNKVESILKKEKKKKKNPTLQE